MESKKPKIAVTVIKFTVFIFIFTLIVAAFYLFGRKLLEKRLPASLNANDITVIIDAGHGGRDGGTVGVDGVSIEKDLNLDISLMICDMLKNSGVNVVMTRTEDISLTDAEVGGSRKNQDLSARLKIAESAANPVFVSVHMNAFPVEKYSGAQVYYSTNDENSKSLANLLQNNVKSLLQNENDRKIKPAGSNIYILDKITCPAVLIECGFLSNSEECAKLADREYRKKMAFVISSTIIEYICSDGT